MRTVVYFSEEIISDRPYTDSVLPVRKQKQIVRPQTELVQTPKLRENIAKAAKMHARSIDGLAKRTFTEKELGRRRHVDTVQMR